MSDYYYSGGLQASESGCVARVSCVAQLECSKIIEHNIWSRRFVELSSINMVSEIEIESSKF